MSGTTLDIIVRAQDEATATINKVAGAGNTVSTSLDKAQSSAGGLSSALKKVGAVIGVAFAATEVYNFAKSSVQAFEDVEKQASLLGVGLDAIGQGAQLDPLLGQLDAVSAATVTLKADTDTVASAVLNIGSAYFDSLGSKAPAALAGVTQGILNISAATHKSLGMLQKSMTMAVVNTPATAIGMLQKLGVVTADQATKFTALAKAGKLAELRQAEMNAVTNAYPGAASRSATSGEKLAKALNDIKIKIGGVLVPIVSLLASFATWSSNNGMLVTTIAAVGLALWGLNTAAVTTFGITIGLAIASLIKFGVSLVYVYASEGVVAAATGVLDGALTLMAANPVTAWVVGLGIAVMTVYNALHESAAQVKAFSDQMATDIPKVTAALAQGKLTAAQYAAGIDALNSVASFVGAPLTTAHDSLMSLNQQLASGQIDQHQYTVGLKGMGYTSEQVQAQVAKVSGWLGTLTTWTKKAGGAAHQFAGMTKDEFKTWADSQASAFSSATSDASNFSRGFGESAHAVVRGLDAMAARAQRFMIDQRRIVQANLGDALTKALLEQPAAVQDAWARGGTKIKDSIEKSLKSVADSTALDKTAIDKASTSIDKIANTNFAPALHSLAPFKDMWSYLATHSNLALAVHATVTGLPPFPGGMDGNPRTPYPMASGGIVTRPTLALIGEAGPEAVIPLGAGGGRPLEVHNTLLIDRRRFSDEIDHDFAYRGY